MNVSYTAEALATGDGRNGHVRTADGRIDDEVRLPPELGGPGGALNPELFLAAGYSTCFHSALQAAARAQKVSIAGSSVRARVHIRGGGADGFHLAVDLEVAIPDVDGEAAQALVDAAHRNCPFSKATRGNIDVSVALA